MKYGIELEFFVKDKDCNIVPAYKVTNNVDGNRITGEIRTGVHDNIVDCVFELKKLVHNEVKALYKKGYFMLLEHTVTIPDETLLALRKDSAYINRKELRALDLLSVYPEGKTGKLLKRNEFKASLQINISKNNSFHYDVFEKITIGKAYSYNRKSEKKNYSSIFNYSSVIMKLDKVFAASIKKANRVSGVYAIKEGSLGERIEYRSLPNDIDLDLLIKTLE